jgi:tetratricopeptide (TPR) repeat protein
MKKYILAIALLFTATSQAFSQSEPPYGMSEIQAYSIFYENYRTGDYNMALQFGKWMLEKKPESIQGVNRFSLPRQYERMISVYSELSKEQSDPSMKSAYLDTAIIIYDDAFETFDENQIDHYEWYFNRGRFYQENQSQLNGGLDSAYADYERAYDLDSERLVQSGDGYYIRILLNDYISDGERDIALELMDEVEPMASQDLLNAIADLRDDLFTNPEERIEFLESRLENNPEDEELIAELSELYDETGNREKALEYAERLYEINKSFENIRLLADYAKDDGQYETAIQYLLEGVDMIEDNDVKKNVTLEISELYQNESELQQARRYARQARDLDSSWGRPYLQIASIYASAISQCTSGRQIERQDRTVYWLVMDYLDRAASVEPSLASTVNRQRNTYEPVLPSAEDKFFSGWESGDSYQIGSNISDCYAWINESTTVR